MEYKLEDICNFYNGGAWSESEYVESGIPVVKVSNIKGNDIVFDNINYISESSLKKYQKNILKTNDVVIATVGSHPSLESSAAGRSVLIPKKINGHLLNQNAVCLRTKDNDILDQKYLGYLVETQAFKNFIQNRGGGAANQMRIPIGAIKSYKFKIPKEQKKIAKILSNYDALIENNLKQIKLLEEKARLTYEEWFLRFKIDGQKLEIDENTGLPFGWELTQLKKISSFINGYAFKSDDFIDVGYPVIKIKNIDNNSVDVYVTDKVSQNSIEKVNDKFKLASGDLLIAMTGATVGKLGFVPHSDSSCYVNQRVGKINSKYLYFIFLSLNSEFGQQQILNFAGGAAQPNISGEQILNVKTIIPSDETLLHKFDELGNFILKEKLNLIRQNQLLKESRDILLPRLMTGLIDVEKLDIKV